MGEANVFQQGMSLKATDNIIRKPHIQDQPQYTPTCLATWASGFGVNRLAAKPGSGSRSAIRSGTRSKSGETDLTGYSLAGELARRNLEVVGCGERMVGEGESGEVGETSSTTVVGTGCAVMGLMDLTFGPVRMLEGRICSKPWSRATFSIDLKY